MTLFQLEYALALKKFGSFNKAAAHLGISQPGLSLQIQKLEEEAGIRLFNRNSTPIVASEDGQLFLLRAEEIVKAADNLKKFTREIHDDFSGHLVIGIIPTLAPFLVPLFADEIAAGLPHLQLEIKELTTERVIEGVRSGQVDAGIISTPLNAYGIQVKPLFYEKFFFYASKSEVNASDIRLEDINYERLWLLEEGNCFRDQVNDFCNLKEIQQKRNFIYRSNSIDALVRIVDTRGGMTILPELTTLSLSGSQEENIREIKGKPKAREIGLIITIHNEKMRYIEKLEYYIKNNVPRHMLDKSNYEIVDPNIKVK